MGTETNQICVHNRCNNELHVKLNNPLMGTETLCSFVQSKLQGGIVKLNNPLMGTETQK